MCPSSTPSAKVLMLGSWQLVLYMPLTIATYMDLDLSCQMLIEMIQWYCVIFFWGSSLQFYSTLSNFYVTFTYFFMYSNPNISASIASRASNPSGAAYHQTVNTNIMTRQSETNQCCLWKNISVILMLLQLFTFEGRWQKYDIRHGFIASPGGLFVRSSAASMW